MINEFARLFTLDLGLNKDIGRDKKYAFTKKASGKRSFTAKVMFNPFFHFTNRVYKRRETSVSGKGEKLREGEMKSRIGVVSVQLSKEGKRASRCI